MFALLMYKQLTGCTYRDLESVSGIDHTTFIKFRRRLEHMDWFAHVFTELTTSVAHSLSSITAILDASFVETYSGKHEEGSGYSGYHEKEGYKLHGVIDFETRLPLLQTATAGNVHDLVGGRTLLDRAPPTWRVAGWSADKAYDSEDFVHAIRRKWENVRVAIPVRKKKGGESVLNRISRSRERSTSVRLYKQRTEIERYHSRKKHVFRFGEEKTRHFGNFRTNMYFTSIMEILEWLAKHPDTVL